MDALLKVVQTINMYLSDYILIVLLIGFSGFYLVEEKKLQRVGASAIIFAICWVLGAFCSLSFGPLSDLKLFGRTIFDFFDNLSSNVLMTLGSLFTVLFVGWRLKRTDIYDEFTNGGTLSTNARIFGVLWFLIRYICPLAIISIFLVGIFG